MDQTLQDFEKAWAHFETGFKGKLRSRSKERTITLSLANLILKEVSADWFSGYGVEGKWLRDYKGENPEKAEALTNYLKHTLRLEPEIVPEPGAQGGQADLGRQENKETSKIKYVLPAIGAVVGGGIAHALHTGYIVQLAAMALPAVALYPRGGGGTKVAKKAPAAADVQDVINSFAGQLQRHRNQIIAIMNG